MKFKAAILEKLNQPLVIKEIEHCPLLYGQVLVKVHSTGICGAQMGEIAGAKGPDKYLPHLMGHEGGGFVVDIGPGVKTVKKDDHVVMHWRKGSGIEAEPAKYIDGDGNIIGAGPVTTFTEYAVVSENRLTSINKTVPFDIAALMGCSLTTAFGLINNEAKLKMGQTIAICGCGGVGLHLILGARLAGAGEIIAIDRWNNKLNLAIKLGATHVINTSGGQQKQSAKESDIFVDCTGVPELINWGYRSTKKMILVGQPQHDKVLILPQMRSNYVGKVMMDSQGGLTNPQEDIPRYVKMYLAGRLERLYDVITHRAHFDKINEVIELIKPGVEVGKSIIRMQ